MSLRGRLVEEKKEETPGGAKLKGAPRGGILSKREGWEGASAKGGSSGLEAVAAFFPFLPLEDMVGSGVGEDFPPKRGEA